MIEVGALQPGDIVDYEIAKKGFTYALLAAGNEDESRFIPPMQRTVLWYCSFLEQYSYCT